MSGLPMRSADTRSEVVHRGAVIDKAVVLKGQICSREDLTIYGQVEGTVELEEHRLAIGLSANVVATIKACEIVVLGTVHSN
ncbi:MAG: polymer-forming cytoskeletal protein, partial [Bryobacteraceae bacterium]